MNIKDIKVGMKVIPHSKTAQGRLIGLENSVAWLDAIKKRQPFLYVTKITKDDSYPEILLSDVKDEGGDYFLAEDVEKYDDRPFQELTIVEEYRFNHKLHPDFLPFDTYDLVQTGYPSPNKGEMAKREHGGTDKNDILLPSTGEWCKVEDAMRIIKELKLQI